jgi:hypothetical protein
VEEEEEEEQLDSKHSLLLELQIGLFLQELQKYLLCVLGLVVVLLELDLTVVEVVVVVVLLHMEHLQ